MSHDEDLTKVHELIRGVLRITTNVMTPDGRKIAVAWDHYDVAGGEPTPCLVLGNTVDEAIRKVVALEYDFGEAPDGSETPDQA